MNNNGGGSSWEGMNPDVVEAQARILRGLSEEVAALMNKIEGETSQLADAWHGDDSNKFDADPQAGVQHGGNAPCEHERHQPPECRSAAGHIVELTFVILTRCCERGL
jgi:hypothetical protein